MKLNSRDAAAWIGKPPPDRPGTLLHGTDAMRVALKRQDLVTALIGPDGETDLRLVRLSPADLRRERTIVSDEMKARGFFPGPRALLIEEATAQHADPILAALKDWAPGDAHLVVTAGSLKPASALRKGFEGHRSAAAIAIYDDPPDRAEIEAALARAGLTQIAPDAMQALTALAHTVDPGDFRQVLEKVALYKHGDPAPLEAADIAACAPVSTDASLDEILGVVTDGKADRIGPLLSRLVAQGVTPVSLCIGAMRHFRTLHTAAADPGGAGSGIGRLRPPVYGPRRDALLRQAQSWGAERLGQALSLLVETDLTLRSSTRAPQMALMERTLIRLAMMGRR
ncbi:DNA polymerase III delta subunit [Palleronia aestuarii]|uniref:DNA-directed DNA polymerase n=1 Tax=Palleronia aestuarii TaxID=568105 RepID=A0A2W7P062_9RHOB|nr:DNA polymerase III subunit delta [Palleronia aestuarii]PZX18856.1 DNA polymerase III delta subunit [Palleronia aestuarii]